MNQPTSEEVQSFKPHVQQHDMLKSKHVSELAEQRHASPVSQYSVDCPNSTCEEPKLQHDRDIPVVNEMHHQLLLVNARIEQARARLAADQSQLRIAHEEHLSHQNCLLQREQQIIEMRSELALNRSAPVVSQCRQSLFTTHEKSKHLLVLEAKLAVYSGELEQKEKKLGKSEACMAGLDSTEKELCTQVNELEEQVQALKHQQSWMHQEKQRFGSQISEDSLEAYQLRAQLAQQIAMNKQLQANLDRSAIDTKHIWETESQQSDDTAVQQPSCLPKHIWQQSIGVTHEQFQHQAIPATDPYQSIRNAGHRRKTHTSAYSCGALASPPVAECRGFQHTAASNRTSPCRAAVGSLGIQHHAHVCSRFLHSTIRSVR